MRITKLLMILVLSMFTTISYARTITVSSVILLQTAINNSVNGDTLLLANGTYVNNTLNISKSNIFIRPTTLGGVFLNGTNSINITGNNVKFSGFQFTSGTVIGSLIKITGNNNTISHLNFNGYLADHMVIIYGTYNLITNCNFQNKPAPNLVAQGGTGSIVQIIPSSTVIGYNTIRYCSFQNIPGFGGDYGNECIRIGDGAYSTYVSRTVVEYCYFENTGNGDSEAISVKSRENCLRFNTMFNNPDAMFAFRNGDNNVAYSNFFISSGGIRCKQSNNIYCYNNYFQQSGIHQNTSLPGGGTYPVYLEYYGTGYGNNFNFINNTFYRCTNTKIDNNITNCTWANNIFYSDSSTVFTGTTSGQSFIGNIYQGLLGLTIPTGMNKVNPLLILNSSNYYGLSPTSPAINASSNAFPPILDIAIINDDPTLLNDISGQTRPSLITLKDVGCDEFTTGITVNRPLSKQDVGPSYLKSVLKTSNPLLDENYSDESTVVSNDNKLLNDILIYPNPAFKEIKVTLNSFTENLIFDIYDVHLRLIESYVLNNNITEITLPNLTNGVYLYNVISNNKLIKTGKLCVLQNY